MSKLEPRSLKSVFFKMDYSENSLTGVFHEATKTAKLAQRLVESLRIKVDLPYRNCVKSVEAVLDELIVCLTENTYELNEFSMKILRDQIANGQNSLSNKDARESFDFCSAVRDCERLRQYRNSAENREHLWPGGSFSGEDGSGAASSPAAVVDSLNTRFKSANPRILYEVIEYAGQGHSDQFQLITLLVDEIKWILQSMESSHSYLPIFELYNICDILLRCDSVHPSVAQQLSMDDNFLFLLPDIMEKLPTDSKMLQRWAKLTTVAVSTLWKNLHDVDMVKNWNFPCDRIIGNWETFEAGGVSTSLKQYVAMIMAIISVEKRLKKLSDVAEILNRYFANIAASSGNTFFKFLIETVINWWNHDGTGSAIDGSNVESDFGLHYAGKLVPEFIGEMLLIRYYIPRGDIFTGIEFHCELVKDRCIEPDSFSVISTSEMANLREICSRVLQDYDPSEDVYVQADLLSKSLLKYAET